MSSSKQPATRHQTALLETAALAAAAAATTNGTNSSTDDDQPAATTVSKQASKRNSLISSSSHNQLESSALSAHPNFDIVPKLVESSSGLSDSSILVPKLGKMFDSIQAYLDAQNEHVSEFYAKSKENDIIELANKSSELTHRQQLQSMLVNALNNDELNKAICIGAMLNPDLNVNASGLQQATANALFGGAGGGGNNPGNNNFSNLRDLLQTLSTSSSTSPMGGTNNTAANNHAQPSSLTRLKLNNFARFKPRPTAVVSAAAAAAAASATTEPGEVNGGGSATAGVYRSVQLDHGGDELVDITGETYVNGVATTSLNGTAEDDEDLDENGNDLLESMNNASSMDMLDGSNTDSHMDSDKHGGGGDEDGIFIDRKIRPKLRAGPLSPIRHLICSPGLEATAHKYKIIILYRGVCNGYCYQNKPWSKQVHLHYIVNTVNCNDHISRLVKKQGIQFYNSFVLQNPERWNQLIHLYRMERVKQN